jgi:hypothetical protein
MIEIPAAADRAPLRALLRQREQVDRRGVVGARVGVPDAAGLGPRVLGQDAKDRLRDHGLARAALADDRHGPVRRDVERHAADGPHPALVGQERDLQVANREQRRRVMPSP